MVWTVAALACPVYFLRYRRSEFNLFLHLIVPVLGAVLLIPVFFAGAGVPAFSFASALSYPLNLAGPIVGAWYVIGIGVMIYLLKRRRASLEELSESVDDDEPAPEHAPKHAAVLARRRRVRRRRRIETAGRT